MPRIPVSQIPQAPGANPPVLTNYPNWQANLSGAARSMTQSQLPTEPFLAPGKGMQAVAGAVQGAGEVLGRLAEQRMRAQEVIDVANAQNFMDENLASFEQEMQTMRPEEWEGAWKKRLPKVAEGLNKLKLSPNAAVDVQARFDRFAGKSSVGIAGESTRESIRLGRQAIINQAETAEMNGDFEGAAMLFQDAVKGGLFKEEEAGRALNKIEQKRRDAWVEEYVATKPFEAAEHFGEAAKAGGSEGFPWMTKDQIIRARDNATRETRIIRGETLNDIDQAILTGEVTTEEEVRELGKTANLSERDTLSLLKVLNDKFLTTPEGIAQQRAALTGARSMVETYDPSEDRDAKGWDEAITSIREVADGEQRLALFQDLRRKRRDGLKPNDRVSKMLFDRIEFFTEHGFFGETGRDEDNKIEDLRAADAYDMRLIEMQDSVERLIKENPGESPEELKKKFMVLIAPHLEDGAVEDIRRMMDDQINVPAPPVHGPMWHGTPGFSQKKQ